jgi:hypothetical protein
MRPPVPLHGAVIRGREKVGDQLLTLRTPKVGASNSKHRSPGKDGDSWHDIPIRQNHLRAEKTRDA